MRLALLIYNSLETLSGGYLYDRRLVDSLRASGDQVEIISLPWRNYPRHLGDNLSAGLRDRLARLKVDILLQDELNHPSVFLINRWSRARVQFQVVSIVHHLRCSELRPAWQNRLYGWVERQYLHSVNHFIFNSQTTCQAVQALLGAGQPVSGLIAYPAGDRFDAQLNEWEIVQRSHAAGPLRILFLGNLIPRKGLHTLLVALSKLAGVDWLLDVVGRDDVDPPYSRRMRRYALSLGLNGRVQFLGRLSDQEVSARLRACHVLAVPSTYEGYGIVYVEGMGFGLPAIATTAGAAREIITDGQDGFLLLPGDTAGLATHMAELSIDRQRLAAMSLAARRRFLSHPTWQASMTQVRQFLSTCMEAA